MLLFKLTTPYKAHHFSPCGYARVGQRPGIAFGYRRQFINLITIMFRCLNQDLNMVKIPAAQQHQAWIQACKPINKHNQSTLLPAVFSPSLDLQLAWRTSLFKRLFLTSPSLTICYNLTASCKEVTHKAQHCTDWHNSFHQAGMPASQTQQRCLHGHCSSTCPMCCSPALSTHSS